MLTENTLIGKKEFPVVSIILSSQLQNPKYKLDREYQYFLSKAEELLQNQYSVQKQNPWWINCTTL